MQTLPDSILVTGAASGIGFELARSLSRQGIRVLAADIDAAGLRELVEDARGEVRTFECDLADSRATLEFFDEANELGYMAAVNCAGTEGSPDYLVAQPAGIADRIIDINIRGTLNCLREELRHLVPRRAGSIVNVSSVYGLRGQPRWAVYSATKAAVIGLTQGTALEVAQSGIRVNAVAPGPIDTPLLQRTTRGDLARTAAMVPMKRNGRVEEVASAIVWLLSDASNFVKGTVLSVDGGMAAQAATVPEIAFNSNTMETA